MTQPKIVMYVRDDCFDVDLARTVLKDTKVAWEEIDIDKDKAACDRVIGWTGRAATPTIWIGDTMLVEPRPTALRKAIEAAALAA